MRPVPEISQLILKDLGISTSTETLENRRTIQFALYLACSAGLDLGYRWSHFGNAPYCDQLAKDYFSAEWDEGPGAESGLAPYGKRQPPTSGPEEVSE